MCLAPACLDRACFRLAERIRGSAFLELDGAQLLLLSKSRAAPGATMWRLYLASLVAWQWRGRGAKKKLGGGYLSVILATCSWLPYRNLVLSSFWWVWLTKNVGSTKHLGPCPTPAVLSSANQFSPMTTYDARLGSGQWGWGAVPICPYAYIAGAGPRISQEGVAKGCLPVVTSTGLQIRNFVRHKA